MRLVISNASGVSLYEQIAEQLRQQIISGELPAGTALPSLRALANDVRVSLITTTRAYNELAAEGLIVNVPGKGSFVAEVDPGQARTTAQQQAREDLRRIVTRARSTGLLSREELISMLNEEWSHEH